MIDTGSQVNILPSKMVHKHGWTFYDVDPSDELQSFDGTKSKPDGKINLPCTIGETTRNLKFYVIKGAEKPILSLPGIKGFEMTIDTTNDCVRNKDGHKIYCHLVTTQNHSDSKN